MFKIFSNILIDHPFLRQLNVNRPSLLWYVDTTLWALKTEAIGICPASHLMWSLGIYIFKKNLIKQHIIRLIYQINRHLFVKILLRLWLVKNMNVFTIVMRYKSRSNFLRTTASSLKFFTTVRSHHTYSLTNET